MKKIILVMIFMSILLFPGCSSSKDVNIETSDTEAVETSQSSTEVTNIEKKEWYEEYDNQKIILTYTWAYNTSNYGLSQESADFIDSNSNLFPTKNKENLTKLVNKELTYNHIQKSYSKYVTTFFDVEGYVVTIEETEVENFGIVTLLHIIDENLQSYQIMYFGEIPDVFNEDTVYMIGLPLGMGGFENVSGGYTNTVIVLGSYIEKKE